MTLATQWVGQSLSQDRYRLREQLAQGPTQHWFLAADNHRQQKALVAIPAPSLWQRHDLAELFLTNARRSAQLGHPHLVDLLEMGTHDQIPFHVMPFYEGGSLSNQPKPVPTDDLKKGLAWINAIARVLDFLHDRDWIHREVIPENILFDGHGEAYLTRPILFEALQQSLSDESGESALMFGSPEFLAPEICEGRPASDKSDQYALAVVAYEHVCGMLPIKGDSGMDTLSRQLQQTPTEPFQHRSEIPRAVSNALMRALSKNPDARFSNCQGFAKAIVQGFRPTVEKVPAKKTPAKDTSNAASAPASVVDQSPANSSPAAPSISTPNPASQPPAIPAPMSGSPALEPPPLPAEPRPVENPASAPAPKLLPCPYCELELSLRDQHRDQHIRCPECDSRLYVSPDLQELTDVTNNPLESDDNSKAPISKSPRRIASPGRYHPYSRRPTRLTLSVAGIVVVLLSVLGVVLFFYTSQNMVEKYQDFIPDHTALVIYLNAETFRGSSLGRFLFADSRSASTGEPVQHSSDARDIPYDQLQRMLVCAAQGKAGAITILEFSVPIDPEQVKKKGVPYIIEPYQDFTFYRAENGEGFCLLADTRHLVVADSYHDLAEVIARKSERPDIAPEFWRRMKQLDDSVSASLLADIPHVVGHERIPDFPSNFPFSFQRLAKAKELECTYNASGSGEFTLALLCQDRSAAQDTLKLIEGMLDYTDRAQPIKFLDKLSVYASGRACYVKTSRANEIIDSAMNSRDDLKKFFDR